MGIGEPVDGDAIYNGALDNATGCAVLLELARAWAALPQKPRRSALFLALTAEEGGLRGSGYYSRRPLFPIAKTALAINFDSISPLGRTRDVIAPGAERTALWPLVQNAARRLELAIKPDPRPELGGYFRSDHFPLARAGVPAFSIRNGSDYFVPPPGLAALTRNYHRPSDEYREDWDFSGIQQVARFGLLIGIDAANQDRLGGWRVGMRP
jgi:Zn-dependent M28 family amino/carboxypeptidase